MKKLRQKYRTEKDKAKKNQEMVGAENGSNLKRWIGSLQPGIMLNLLPLLIPWLKVQQRRQNTTARIPVMMKI